MEQPELKLADALAQKRTDLAAQRNRMAANRTLMAWVRTAISFIGFGFTIYKFLQSMQEHRAVLFLENRRPHFDPVLGSDGQEVPVVSGVVELAQRQPVGNDGLAVGLRISDDVRRVEQFLVPQPAQRASPSARSRSRSR